MTDDATERCVLALDQGGSSSRAIAFDARGEIVASASVPVGERREGDDRVEQDPEELVESLRGAAAECARAAGGARAFACAGLATQRSSIVCWDRATGAALSPVLSWQDRRAAAWLAPFAARAESIHRETGLFLSPHYGASKLRWCLDHLEQVRRARADGRLAMGPLASFLAFRLLEGRPFVADPANASRTLLWSIRSRDFDAKLLELFGIPRETLPRCVPTRGAIGALTIGGERVPFRVLTGDQSAAVFAHGPPREDTAYVNVGTGAFVQRPCRHVPEELPRLLASLAFDDGAAATFVVEGTINGAGSAVKKIADELGVEDVERQLEGFLRAAADPPLFLNGVSGLAAPFWLPDFVSSFVGDGKPPARIAAVVESIVFLACAILEEMERALPRPARIEASGGLARVDGLCARLASLSGLPVDRAPESEATSRGLAWLLGGAKTAWPAASAMHRFEVAADASLAARYRRWRAEMDRAVAAR
ncbi:MAG TPA: FGGY family carbohydrate kinase [Planctomycetota bacterium]|jgi:glycerol kinase|nr:FGGY family carbohydrate kinase [Planctomycetota bacterium]